MEYKVKSFKRRTKSGKVVTVRAHSRKGKDGTIHEVSMKGKGKELELIKNIDWDDATDGYLPDKDNILAASKALGISPVEAISWYNPDYTNFNPAHSRKGEKAAKKFLGSSVYKLLDPTGPDVPNAVFAKIKNGREWNRLCKKLGVRSTK